MSLLFPNIIFKKKANEDKYEIQFAPDGVHWQEVKSGKVENLWDDFISNSEYRTQVSLNPSAKFRLINIITGKVIGEFPRESVESKKAFLKKAKLEEKEPWQMTAKEFWGDAYPEIQYTFPNGIGTIGKSPSTHRAQVEKALASGKPVPLEVLAEYPDLVK